MGDDSSFEDICDIGKNMYNLLIGPRSRPPPGSRNTSNNSTPTKGGHQNDAETSRGTPAQANSIGNWSHGAAHSSLAGAAGQDLIRSWRLPSPTKLADKLKNKLMSEVANAEWEVLDEDAWAIERPNTELGDDAVVVGARRSNERGYGLGMQSFMSMRTIQDANETMRSDGERDKKLGQNGWTKLKPR